MTNKYIREQLGEVATNYGAKIHFPELADSTDNAQMIAVAGYLKSFIEKPQINPEIKAIGNLTY